MERLRRLYAFAYVSCLVEYLPLAAFFLTAHFSQDDYPYDW